MTLSPLQTVTTACETYDNTEHTVKYNYVKLGDT